MPCSFTDVYYTLETYIGDKKAEMALDLSLPFSWFKARKYSECLTSNKGNTECEQIKH